MERLVRWRDPGQAMLARRPLTAASLLSQTRPSVILEWRERFSQTEELKCRQYLSPNAGEFI